MQHRIQRQPITAATEAADHTERDIRKMRMVAERLTRKHIGQVYLDERNSHRRKRIAQRNAGMRKRPGVAQDRRSPVLARLMYTTDQFVLGVGLEPGQLVSCRVRAIGQLLIDVSQRFVTIDFRLTCAQQIEVGSMQDQDFCQRRRPDRARIFRSSKCARSPQTCPVHDRSTMFGEEASSFSA